MRVLGVDPGSHHLGWGIIDVHGSQLKHVDSGTLHAPKQALAQRLYFLGSHLETLLATYKPESAAVEQVFHSHNSRSALILGHARGTVLYCLGRLHIPVFEYAPTQIKQATTGRGAAEKTQVQMMVRMLLGLQQHLGLDQSDALAAAICHMQHAPSHAIRTAQPLGTASTPRKPDKPSDAKGSSNA